MMMTTMILMSVRIRRRRLPRRRLVSALPVLSVVHLAFLILLKLWPHRWRLTYLCTMICVIGHSPSNLVFDA